MSRLVSLDNAKIHLRMESATGAAEDDIQLKLDEAEALVLDYVTQRIGSTSADWTLTVEAWDEDTVPRQVVAAVLEQLTELHRFRGDDEPTPSRLGDDGALTRTIRAKLYRLRDPALA